MICKFRDLDDTAEQIWGHKRAIWEFSDRDDPNKQVWGPKQSIYEFMDRDNTAEQVQKMLVDFTQKKHHGKLFF